MKLVTSLPIRDFNFISVNGENFIYTNNAVFSVSLKRLLLKNLGRWSGAKITNVAKINDRYLVGSDKGLIVFFNDKNLPIWAGEKTFIIPGNFSEDVLGLALTIHREENRRYLKVSKVTKEVVFGEERRLFGEEKIPFFTPFGGVTDEYINQYLLGLINVLDTDRDGRDELFIITPGVEASFITRTFISDNGNIEVQYWELPSYTFRPIVSVAKDIDLDGYKEIFLLSNPESDVVVSTIINIEPNNVKAQAVHRFSFRETFGEKVSMDAEIWGYIGDIDGDKFNEIVYILEEKPKLGEIKSSLYMLIKRFMGDEKLISKPIEEFPLENFFTKDVDGDGVEELLLVTPVSLTVYSLKKRWEVKKDREIFFIYNIEGVINEAGYLISFGPILTKPMEMWGYYLFKEKSGDLYMGSVSGKIKKITFFGKNLVLLDFNGTLYISEGNNIKVFNKGISDIEKVGDRLYVAVGNVVQVLDKSFNKFSEIEFGGKVISLSKMGEKIFITYRRGKKIFLTDEHKKMDIKLGAREIVSFIPLGRNKVDYIVVSGGDEICILNHSGEKIFGLSGIRLDYGKYVVLDVDGDGSRELIFVYGNELYLVDMKFGDIIRSLGIKNWSAISLKDVEGEKFYIAYDDAIYEADRGEVLA